jgi:DNA invertase Pin-like site-specific DNA recombinase
VRLGYFRTNGDGASKQELRALEEAGCDKILVDSVVGHRSKTLASWLDDLATGDELVVLRLGHLMPMPGLLDLLTQLVARGIIVQSLLDDLRTSDPGVTATVMLLSRYRGQPMETGARKRGRTPVLSAHDLERARQMIMLERVPVAQVATLLGVSRATLYRHVPVAA